mmetsp:Transcript_2017/g.3574  ORF Transcript_2017/g.3574 Transcript_2017/m.3574 type:complete len:325 (-) Transcript_2017:94-1068(-)
MGTALILDAYALLAAEYDVVHDIVVKYRVMDVSVLPNWMMSKCIVDVMRGNDRNEFGNVGRENDCEMEHVLIVFPILLECILKVVERDGAAVEGKTLEELSQLELFRRDYYRLSREDGIVERIAKIYAMTSSMFWKSSSGREAVMWLKRCAVGANETYGKMADTERQRVADKRKQAVEMVDAWGVFDNVNLSDFGDALSNQLPQHFLVEQQQQQLQQREHAERGAVLGHGAGRMDVLRTLIGTLMPWNSAGDVLDDVLNGDELNQEQQQVVVETVARAVSDPNAEPNGLFSALFNAIARLRHAQPDGSANTHESRGENDGDREE